LDAEGFKLGNEPVELLGGARQQRDVEALGAEALGDGEPEPGSAQTMAKVLIRRLISNRGHIPFIYKDSIEYSMIYCAIYFGI
jgi:hypothetical protein